MTHISRKKINSIDYTKAQQQLVALLARCNTNSASHVINELFSESERIMVIKRFAAIFMFQHNYSYYRVSQTVGISSSTAKIILQNYLTGRYDKLLASISKTQKIELLAIIEDFMLSKVSGKARTRLIRRTMK